MTTAVRLEYAEVAKVFAAAGRGVPVTAVEDVSLTVDPDMLKLARSFKAKRAQIFWKIEFPASMPALFSGVRIGSTLAVIGVVVGELVSGNMGLGYLLVFGEGAGNTAMVFVSIILLTLIGIVAYIAVILVERRVLHYLPRQIHQPFQTGERKT